MTFLNYIFFWKISVDFWHWKLTLKVRFWHFLKNRNSSTDFLKKKKKSYIFVCWFFGKNLAFQDPSSLKIHNRTDTLKYILVDFEQFRWFYCRGEILIGCKPLTSNPFTPSISASKKDNEKSMNYWCQSKPENVLFRVWNGLFQGFQIQFVLEPEN